MPIKNLPDGNKIVILSYSAFSIYKQCPHRYYREKILREKTGEEDLSYNIPGIIVHKAVENYLKTGDERFLSKPVIEAAVDKHSTDPQVDLIKAYGSIEKCKNFTMSCAQNIFCFLLTKQIRKRPHYSEVWFGDWDNPLMLSPNLATQGAADLIEINQNGTGLLYDYKATWSTKNLNREQLILYAIAAERVFNVPISMAAFFLLPSNKQDFFHIDTTIKQNFINQLQEIANNILALGENLPCTPSEKCERCPFASSCEHSKDYTPTKYVPPKGNFGGFGLAEL